MRFTNETSNESSAVVVRADIHGLNSAVCWRAAHRGHSVFAAIAEGMQPWWYCDLSVLGTEHPACGHLACI
jgi:hypothetical protein